MVLLPNLPKSRGLAYLVMLKKLSSEVSADSDIKYMPVVIFFACLDFEQKTSFRDRH